MKFYLLEMVILYMFNTEIEKKKTDVTFTHGPDIFPLEFRCFIGMKHKSSALPSNIERCYLDK